VETKQSSQPSGRYPSHLQGLGPAARVEADAQKREVSGWLVYQGALTGATVE
jgi:hypothetical protein